MKTSAENRRVRQILSAVGNEQLIPRPDFQRLLVWSNADKLSFIDTVLKEFPFPEIYVATGEVDLETGLGSEMLVDGQQRITTLHQYFSGSPLIRLGQGIVAYADLTDDRKAAFLNYEVPVRNLGIVTHDQIVEVFRRINATSYDLNAMEIHNAVYRGPLKQLADALSEEEFFSEHRIFSAQEVRRKRDVVFVLTVIISMMSTYFHRDDEIENFLDQYNDEFPESEILKKRFERVKTFISKLNFDKKSRAWKKTDLLVLFVEIDRIFDKDKQELEAKEVRRRLDVFYARVERELKEPTGDEDLQAYIRTTVQATNDRASRVNRGRVLRKAILGEI